MRVQRFPFKTARTVRAKAPWAKAVVKVGDICVAYESADEARENHAGVRLDLVDAKPKRKRGRPRKVVPLILPQWGGTVSISWRAA